MVSLFLTLSLSLHILVSLLLTLNIFHILYDVKNAKILTLYWKKERTVSITDCKWKCFSSRIYAQAYQRDFTVTLEKKLEIIGWFKWEWVGIDGSG